MDVNETFQLKLNGEDYTIKEGDGICWDDPAPTSFTTADDKQLDVYINGRKRDLYIYMSDLHFDLLRCMLSLVMPNLKLVETVGFGSFRIWKFMKKSP